jgi:hypothetical protein
MYKGMLWSLNLTLKRRVRLQGVLKYHHEYLSGYPLHHFPTSGGS